MQGVAYSDDHFFEFFPVDSLLFAGVIVFKNNIIIFSFLFFIKTRLIL